MRFYSMHKPNAERLGGFKQPKAHTRPRRRQRIGEIRVNDSIMQLVGTECACERLLAAVKHPTHGYFENAPLARCGPSVHQLSEPYEPQ
jgi:hypothetical protein